MRFLLLFALALVGCAPAASGGEASRPASEPSVVVEEDSSEPFRVLSPSERVPPFRVVAVDGTVFDSGSLIGKQPFVVAFWATWCGVCELKLPELAAVLADAGGNIPTIGVSVDARDTWNRVSGYATQHRLPFPTVRGESFPRFATAYDPFETVPVVAVVGKNGYLVDYQIGYSATHAQRLRAALELAQRMTRDAPPLYERQGDKKPEPDESELSPAEED